MDKKYQIFVSSTYNDLKDERQIVIDTIMKLRHIPAGMELFSATGENQFETIKPVIYESDYYLLIIAGKYGSICKETGISYTEMEYDFAIQNHKRIIAFVNSNPDDLPSADRELTDKMMKKLKKFRKKVMENKMVKMWHNKKELFQSIPISISTVIEMYPSNTCWIHVNEDDIYTPIGNYIPLEENFEIALGNNVTLYSNNLTSDVIKIRDNKPPICLTIDLLDKGVCEGLDVFAGCSIKLSSEAKDWARYVLNKFCLQIVYSLKADEDISIWIEIKSYTVEMYKQVVLLNVGGGVVSIYLKDYLEDIEDWKKVKEICFVFRPTEKRVIGVLEINRVWLGRL